MSGSLPQSLPKLARHTDLTARIASTLRPAIVRGDLVAGQRLVPETIAAALGVSRPPVMQAIRQLAREGLVSIGDNGRPHVAGLTRQYVADLYRFRLILDEATVAASLGDVPSEADAALRALVAEMIARAAEGDLTAVADLDLSFHTEFLTLAQNPFILSAWRAISDVSSALLTVTDQLVPELPQIARIHLAIVDGLCSGDEARAMSALHRHYELGQHVLDFPYEGS